MNYFLKKNKGFSLLELLLAIAIFALGSVAMATLLIDSNIVARHSLERKEALNCVKEGIEITRSIKDNNWDDLEAGEHGIDITSDPIVFSGSSDTSCGKYTRVIGVEDVSTTTKNVSVNVSWDLTPNRPISITLDTILYNWR